MNEKYLLLYNDMLADIARCLTLDHPEKENVESCFWIAMNYWERLQSVALSKGFVTDKDEISFYKAVKPKFASYIEYFSLLSEGLTFAPPWIPYPASLVETVDEMTWRRKWNEQLNDYWIHEEKRGQRFYGKNQVFLNYCETGCTEHDSEYFLSRSNSASEISQRRSHNRETNLFTVHEEILTTWEAYKLYREYIKSKCNEPARS